MENHQLFLLDYENTLSLSAIPERLKKHYTVSACLKDRNDRQVYLLTEKMGGNACILKVSPLSELSRLQREHNLLMKLHDTAFPHPMACFTEGGLACLLREYIPGSTLLDFVENSESVTQKRALFIAVKVCEVIEKLHGMQPPYIHRDIKPQNVILSDRGTVHLADLDAAQEYCPGKSLDTEVIGTAMTAAPEQFGYQRCDPRADVYGIGMLLVYLLTASYEQDGIKKLRISPRLKRTIAKCLAFDPGRRYATVVRLRRRLTSIAKHRRGRLAAAALAALVALTPPAYQLYHRIDIKAKEAAAMQADDAVYGFQSPLIEKAVRLQLDRPEGVITIGDLREVNELCLCGSTAFLHWEDAGSFGWTLFVNNQECASYDFLEDTSDLLMMPNLRKLALYRLQITDLTDIARLSLTHLSVGFNRIKDLSPLTKLPRLMALDISSNPVTDLSPINSLLYLDTLNISGTSSIDLSFLHNLNLREFLAYQMPPRIDFSPLVTQQNLFTFGSSDVTRETVDIACRLPRLASILFFSGAVDSLSPFSALENLSSLHLYSTRLTSLYGVNSIRNLSNLSVQHNKIESLSELAGNTTIERLNVYGNPVTDFSLLNSLPALQWVSISPEQEAYFSKPINSYPFDICFED